MAPPPMPTTATPLVPFSPADRWIRLSPLWLTTRSWLVWLYFLVPKRAISWVRE